MSTRPEILFPLFAELTNLDGIGPKIAQNLAGLGVEKPLDVLMTLPASGIDRTVRDSVSDFVLPTVVTVEVEIETHNPPSARGRPYRITVNDGQTRFQLVFFHARGDYLMRILPVGERRVISGKAEGRDNQVQMVHPDHMVDPADGHSIPRFEPVYPLTAGVTQKVMFRATRSALTRVPECDEWIDPGVMRQEAFPSWAEALDRVHNPTSPGDVAPDTDAHQRLAYDELFAHQLTLALAREQGRRKDGVVSKASYALQNRVLSALPYAPTGAQSRAIEEILADIGAPHRMNRLLQGDVGAGKTLVAFMALLAVVEAGGQGVLMAPTEILARQHLDSLRDLAMSAGISLEVLTGRDKGRDRVAKLDALKSGAIDILVGTHAVFQKDVFFHDLRLAVIDEQHRFGVRQRLELGAKGRAVDVLVMTATPIPRSLSLAQYGDMDLSILDEKPAGRQPITTALVSTARIDEVIANLKRAVSEGKQAYWVCPLVEESETMDLIAAEERFKILRAALGEGVVGMVHGQMPVADKDAAMEKFVTGETRILVATTVIEVGVNVPNATIMVIERAETFGLAQLHQLRGRVGRGSDKSTCLMMYKAPMTKTGEKRLTILRESEDGFYISEQDLLMRGAGDVIGTEQSGLPRFRVADLERQAGLMEIAQTDARKLLFEDPTLTSPRGKAARVLLWLMEQEKTFQLISVG